MKKSYVTTGAIILSFILIVLGVVLKQPNEVMTKAIRICLECVGIG